MVTKMTMTTDKSCVFILKLYVNVLMIHLFFFCFILHTRERAASGGLLLALRGWEAQTHMGQTHMWDRHTYGTDTHLGQTHIWDRQTHIWDRHTYGTDTHGL